MPGGHKHHFLLNTQETTSVLQNRKYTLWEISGPVLHVVAAAKRQSRIQCCTFDRVWIGRLYGAEHLSAQGRVHSARWRTWWSHSTAHSLWAWSLTREGNTTGKSGKINVSMLFPVFSLIYMRSNELSLNIKSCVESSCESGWNTSTYLASRCIWQKVGLRSKAPHAISQTACESLFLLGPSQILEPRSR